MTNPISESNTNLISQTIEKLRAFSEVDVRSTWRCFSGDISVAEVFASDFSCWDTTELNAKGHIAWEKGKKVLWLAQKLVVPEDLQGYPLLGMCLRLALVWWADSAQVYINGYLVGNGDLFDFSQRVLLTQSATPGEEFTVALRLVSPGHDNGALVSSRCLYEAAGNQIYPGFVAAELAIAQRYCEAFATPELDIVSGLAKEVSEEIDFLDFEDAGKDKKQAIDKSLVYLQDNLQSKIQNPKTKIYLVGHAHLDMAWLWPVSETWEAAKRTFTSVLKLQEDFEELIFSHSTPALYAWVEENSPDLFEQIKKAVENKRWEVVGGFWVEPELNIISGESIVRQLLYGQRYVQEKFGELSTVVWVPDSFGFCWTLPQFLVSAGVEYFVTQKLMWNDTTKFPHGAFWWLAPDGSEIFSLMSAPIGEGIDPVKMVEYSIAWEKQTGLQDYLWLPGVGDHGGGPTRDMLEVARRWQNSPFCPKFEFTTVEKYLQEINAQEDKETSGQGDNIETSTPSPPSPPNFPTWNDELYLEFHRGCYTTHGDQKRYNRRGENLLYEAELFAALASICSGVDYPQAEIEGAWKKLLFNQFHDILPGSSIAEVYEDAKPEWQQMENTASEILKQSLQVLTNQINLPQPPQPHSLPIVVFNSLNWQRSEVVSVSLPTAPTQEWQVYDTSGNEIISQLDADSQLLFLASDIPSIGYRLFWLSPSRETSSETIALEFSEQKTPSENSPETIALGFSDQKTPSENLSETIALEFSDRQNQDSPETIALQFNDQKTPSENSPETIALQFSDRHNQDSPETIALQFNDQKTPSENSPETIALQFKLENEYLRVVIDEQTGDLKSVFDKVNNRSVLCGNGNQLQAFTDKGQYWDAWNIDPNYAEHILPPLELKSIEWLEQGLLQNRLRIVRQLGESEFIQDYILQAASPVLKIATKVNWLERHILVKAAFGLNLEADFVTYEIPCGAIRRTTKPQTAAEKAKWEVPALRWADLTLEQTIQEEKDSYGVSLLNDCKYGYDAQPNQLRLSLLRSPEWPNPEADKGFHEFSYGLYPHAGSWETAQTVKRGYEFNQPLIVVKSEHKFNTSKNAHLTEASKMSPTQTVKDKASFIDISAQNLILMAFKPTEDNPKQLILRCYECHGETAIGNLTSDIGLNVTESVDLLERPLPNSELSSESKIFTIKPWKIASFTVNL